MTIEISTIEPTKITAGDSVAWDRKDLIDYPTSDGWSLFYSISGPEKITILAAIYQNYFQIRVDPVVTRTWPAGEYWWDAYVSKAVERYKIASGKFTVLPNLQEVAKGYDGRTLAEKELAGWEDLLYKLSQKGSSSVTHGGKVYVEKDLDKVRMARDDAQARVNQEKARTQREKGKATGRKILMRFVNPR